MTMKPMPTVAQMPDHGVLFLVLCPTAVEVESVAMLMPGS